MIDAVPDIGDHVVVNLLLEHVLRLIEADVLTALVVVADVEEEIPELTIGLDVVVHVVFGGLCDSCLNSVIDQNSGKQQHRKRHKRERRLHKAALRAGGYGVSRGERGHDQHGGDGHLRDGEHALEQVLRHVPDGHVVVFRLLNLPKKIQRLGILNLLEVESHALLRDRFIVPIDQEISLHRILLGGVGGEHVQHERQPHQPGNERNQNR